MIGLSEVSSNNQRIAYTLYIIICYSDVECKMIYFVSAVYTIDIGTAELPLIANTVMAL